MCPDIHSLQNANLDKLSVQIRGSKKIKIWTHLGKPRRTKITEGFRLALVRSLSQLLTLITTQKTPWFQEQEESGPKNQRYTDEMRTALLRLIQEADGGRWHDPIWSDNPGDNKEKNK